MLELNKVHKVDVMEGMRQLDDNSIDLIMGSGTVALAAKQNNCDWIGFDLFDEYIQMTNNRIKN